MDDVNLSTGLARCRSCERVQIHAPAGHAAALAPAEPLARPPAVTETREGGRFVLAMSWYNNSVLFLIPFCIAWDAFLIFWYASALGGSTDASGGISLLMLVFPIGHVAAGVGLTWHTLATLFNRTTFALGGGRFEVSHGPVPWYGGLDVREGAVRQLYVVESAVRRNNARTWKLCAKIGDTSRELVTGIVDLQLARYIEQRLEAQLGIADARVAGEVG